MAYWKKRPQSEAAIQRGYNIDDILVSLCRWTVPRTVVGIAASMDKRGDDSHSIPVTVDLLIMMGQTVRTCSVQ